MKKIYFLLLFSITSFIIFAQSGNKVVIKGKIIDAQTETPLSYATIQIYNNIDNKLLTGDISGDDGQFNIETTSGEMYALIDFIGYKQLKSANFVITSEQTSYDIGIIKLASASTSLKEVVVQAEKSTMELSLDKRIFNVGKDLGNAGGSATEILNNIPSVTVDAEGNVKLRGNGNVRILIDGKPSGLVSFKGGSGLQQLQGSLVDKVEIITNPSARYEAEGMTGIINIVLKKSANKD